QVQRFLTAKSVAEGRTSLLMSAFVKIPMQFLILFIGVMVFVFYQFNQPPLIFKADDRAKVEQRAEYQALNQEYAQAFNARKDAAVAFADDANTEAGKQSYLVANNTMDGIRNRAITFWKQATGNTKFNDTNYVFPSFITTYAPPGVVGLIIAAIFAAAMSTISAELASLSTATVMDFYKRHYRKEAADAHYLKVSKFVTGAWGLFACIVALNATKLGSLIEVVNKFGSYFYGSLLGVFVLAIGTKRATGNGAFFGLIAGVVAVFAWDRYKPISFLWYNLIGCVVVVVVGMLISVLVDRRR
ncbi:MAG: sodium:solute symporter, partial [Acidobacteria bacterium]|nr:sodium:solute symporter [Acidobacteriota bacterium]